MVKGIFTALLGMRPIMRRQDLLSNNLANINTTGFKGSDSFVRSYIDILNNDEQNLFMNDNMKMDEVKIDFRQGKLIETGNKLDLAIYGNGFFTVKTPKGVLYTRNGAFTLSGEGHLVNHLGHLLLDENGGPISVRGKNVNVLKDGNVEVDGNPVGKIKLTDFARPYQLEKVGDNLFRPFGLAKPERAEKFSVHSGMLEGSNVNSVETMVKMMAAFRNFEADQRMLHAQDQTLERAVNEVGRIR